MPTQTIYFGKYKNEDEFIKITKKLYDRVRAVLLEVQINYRTMVDEIYNLNGNSNSNTNASPLTKFAAYMIKNQLNIGGYSGHLEVYLDNYAQRENDLLDYANKPIDKIINDIENGKISLKKSHVYSSVRLSNILYIILERITECENLPIKKCQNCGKYFIPSARQDEVYCDFADESGKTCKEKGAGQTYKKKLEEVPALLEYRRTYQKRIMIVSRNKENSNLKVEFDEWKKKAQAQIKLFKKGKLSQEDLYKWMIENR